MSFLRSYVRYLLMVRRSMPANSGRLKQLTCDED
jgi:hypothetical protein